MRIQNYLSSLLLSCLLFTKSYAQTPVEKAPITEADVRLQHFVIGSLTIQDLTFEQAIYKLVSRYETICEESHDKPIVFKFEFPKKNNEKMNFVLDGNFQYQLKQISAIYGKHIELNANTYKFINYKHNPKIVTKVIRVAPDFKESIDPRILHDDKLKKTVHSRAKSVLIVTGEKSSIDRIRRITNNLRDHKPIQIKASTKWIVMSPTAITAELKKMINTRQLSAGQCQLLCRLAAKTKGTKIYTFPSILLRNNEQATIEIIQELPPKEENTAKAFADEKPVTLNWAGYKLTLKSSFVGSKIRAISDVHFHHCEGITLTDNRLFKHSDLDGKIEIEELHSVLVSQLESGNSQIARVKSPDTSIIYQVITLTKIDATGKVIPSIEAQP